MLLCGARATHGQGAAPEEYMGKLTWGMPPLSGYLEVAVTCLHWTGTVRRGRSRVV